ncbi:mitochondrial ribosome recycling factor 1 [Lycorma delicatula]|uniref:mitochondrial ribosome recycling factor 1 n=1 Tax=Lycorma delicatula TaxID=130591 RepID=UPI003F50F8B4
MNIALRFVRPILQLSRRQNTVNQGQLFFYGQCHKSKGFSKVSNLSVCQLALPVSVDKINVRFYAKGKDKKKGDKKGKNKVIIDENILVGIVDVEKLHAQMQNSIESLKEDYVKNLSLRSNAGSVEGLAVKFEGSEYRLQELAQVIRQNPKSIILNMSAFPQAIPAVLEAIEKSGMNLNPQQDGTKLFIPVPKVTKELRESLAKNAKALFIKCRSNLKDVQVKYHKTIKGKEIDGLSVDLSHSAADQVTAICDSYVAQAEKLLILKESELKGE